MVWCVCVCVCVVYVCVCVCVVCVCVCVCVCVWLMWLTNVVWVCGRVSLDAWITSIGRFFRKGGPETEACEVGDQAIII